MYGGPFTFEFVRTWTIAATNNPPVTAVPADIQILGLDLSQRAVHKTLAYPVTLLVMVTGTGDGLMVVPSLECDINADGSSVLWFKSRPLQCIPIDPTGKVNDLGQWAEFDIAPDKMKRFYPWVPQLFAGTVASVTLYAKYPM